MIIQARTWNFIQLLCLLVCQFAFFQRIFDRVLPCRRTTPLFLRKVRLLVIYQLLQLTFVIRTSLCIVPHNHHSFCIHAECVQSLHNQEHDVGSSRSSSFINFFHMGAIFCLFPDILMSSTFSDKRINLVFGEQTSILLSNCLTHSSPARGCPHKFRSRGTSGSSMFDHDFGHLCRGSRIHISGHSDFGILRNFGASSIFNWVYADVASAACQSQSVVLHWNPWPLLPSFVTQMSLVQWKLRKLQSRLSQCHLGARLYLWFFFWKFGSNSAFLRWHKSINDAKWTLLFSLLPLRPEFSSVSA